jgi:LysM repeat protein
MRGIRMPDTYTPGQATKKPGMKKNTKTWLLIGGLGVGGVVIWYVIKNRSSSSSTNAATAAGSGIDPTTGIPYADEYDTSGLGTTPSLAGYVDPTTGAYISGAGATPTQVLAPSTNASWAQQVESYLEGLGYDPTTVAAAIGKYLTGQGLTSDQSGIVAAAQGFFGNPPQGAPAPVTIPPTGQNGGSPSPVTKALGGQRLYQIAEKFGLTVQQLFALNPNLRKYEGKPIPKGTKITL